MKRYWILGLMLPCSAIAQQLVTPNQAGVAQDQPYFTQDVRNTRLIFTDENKQHAAHTAAVEHMLQPLYEETFGYQMDATLSVGLMSSYNQIANGFSTQFPLNRQVNYMGGAQLVDYFSSSSWLNTLLLHETAHNYQVNAKDNGVSSTMFSVLHNGYIVTPLLPAVLPNTLESSFMLEGNAVLNESWHGQGGRLYSGRYRAMTHVHAHAGNLTPARLYNQTLNFPYGEGAYIFGSQYQYYLAETYGLDEANKYFKNRSKYWYWPFMVNRPMQHTVGVNFDTSFAAWEEKMRADASDMQLANGDVIARSKFYAELNKQDGEIVFMSNPDGVRAPFIVRYNTGTGEVDKQRSSLDLGKVYRIDDKDYAVSGRRTSVWRTYQGLFDENAMIKDGSEGQVHQGYMSDGREVYFNTRESFVKPQLYVGDEFYDEVNSSVLVKDDALYYFLQQGNERTLYRNKEALVSLTAFYAVVSDVDSQGRVYFIANSKTGSSLYRSNNGAIERVLAADNVVNARLVNDKKVLAMAISADDYYYSVEDVAVSSEQPFVVKLLWDDEGGLASSQQQTFATMQPEDVDTETPYGFFRNIRYSSGNITLMPTTVEDDQGEEQAEFLYDISFEFSDPLDRNTFSLWATRDAELSDLLGVGFSTNQYFLLAGINAYYVLNDGYEDSLTNTQTRDDGVAVQLRLPFIETGFWYAEIASNYYQDYKLDEREPLSFQLDVSRTEMYGNSWLANKQFGFTVYAVDDRDDKTQGAAFTMSTDLPAEFYIRLSGKYSDSDTAQADRFSRRGVELSRSAGFAGNDPSSFSIPSLYNDSFAQSVSMAELSLNKVLNLSAYSFKGPVSLRRERVELAYRQYAIEGGNGSLTDVDIGQVVLGMNFDLRIMNTIPIGIGLEYIYSDDETLTDKSYVQAGLSLPL